MTLDGGPKNRILLITYHFPPSAAVGGRRIANFAKWLPSFGWQPHVLTIQDKNVESMDRDRLRDVEGIAIHKVGVQPTVTSVYRATKLRLFEPPTNSSPLGTGLDPLASPDPARKENLSRKLKRYLLSFLGLPDFQRGWIIPATLAAIRRLRRHRIEWIMTSCPPYSVHLVGLAVKIINGAKWVADFRDPWMTTGSKRMYPTCAMSIRIESWLERKVIEKADLVLFNVERLKNVYRERYSHVSGEKFVFIPNGIATQALEGMVPVTKYESFTLSYTGSLYAGRSPEPVFQAISQLIREGKTTPEAARIKLVGHCRTVGGVPTDSLIRKYGLESSVEVCDSLPYSDALQIIRRSHLALLFAPRLPYQIPAKVYDYLGAGVRILAIAEDGGTADLICSTGSGRAFSPEDSTGIKDFIYDEMVSQRSTIPDYAAGIARFDVRRITEELVQHMDQITTTPVADSPAADAPRS